MQLNKFDETDRYAFVLLAERLRTAVGLIALGGQLVLENLVSRLGNGAANTAGSNVNGSGTYGGLYAKG